jgi:hypothetical protein
MTNSVGFASSARSAWRVDVCAAAAALIALSAAARADDVSLAETGSTLLYPLFNVWVPEYTKVYVSPPATPAQGLASNRQFPAWYRSGPLMLT